MVQPIDIAQAVHAICEEELIPRGISPQHGIEMHAFTTSFYAEKLNSGGMAHVSGEQVAQAIIEAAAWDKNSPWKGHPLPEKVIQKLKEER